MQPLDPFKIELEKSHLIEASAGTGKTYTITTLFSRLVAEGYAVSAILVVTFTEAAAAELKHRIRQRLIQSLGTLESDHVCPGDEFGGFFLKGSAEEKRSRRLRIKAALASFDEAAIMTIHAFCLKMLTENAFESRTQLGIRLVPDITFLDREITADFLDIEISRQDPLLIKLLKNRNITLETLISDCSPIFSRPTIKVVPENFEITGRFEQYRTLTTELVKIIDQDRAQIEQLLLTHPGVNKRSYSKASVPRWLDMSSRDLLRENCLFNFSEKGDVLYKFCRSRLEEKNKKGEAVPEHPFFDGCELLLKMTQEFEDCIAAVRKRFISFYLKEAPQRKERLGIVSFDDLVNHLADALESSGAEALIKSARKSYHAGLIDEFQDTDQRQYFIFRKLFSGRESPFFMIGDPKQAIYGFRGGDIYAYLEAVEDTRQRRYTLSTNWRSDPLLVQAVNTVFEAQKEPFFIQKIPFTPVKTPESAVNRLRCQDRPVPPMQFLFIPRNAAELERSGMISKDWAQKNLPSIVAHDILGLLRSKISLEKDQNSRQLIQPKDIAILVRTNLQASLIEQALGHVGISACLSASGSVFDAPQAQGMTDFLSAVLSPFDKGFIKAALCSDVVGMSFFDAAELDTEPEKWLFWSENFSRWKNLWENNGFAKMIHTVFRSEVIFKTGSYCLNKRNLTNYYHLAELLIQAANEQHLTPPLLLEWLKRQQNPKLRISCSDELRLESDLGAVAIVTIHKSKGLEYPVVYLPFLWEGSLHVLNQCVHLYHDPENKNCQVFDLGSSEIDQAREQALFEEKAENRRLLYVALTRATALVRIFWGGFKSVDQSALGTLLHPGVNLSDKEMLINLERLEKDSDGSIAVDQWIPAKAQNQPWIDTKNGIKRSARNVFFKIDQHWRFSSFSQVTSQGKVPETGIQDHDSQDAGEDHDQSFSKRQILLAEFPKGTIAGIFFHSLLEDLDFRWDMDQIQTLTRKKLIDAGFDENVWVEPVAASCQDLLRTSLPGNLDQFCLSEVNTRDRLTEFEFLFPFDHLSREVLVKAFQRFPSPEIPEDYAHRLDDLEFEPARGYMKGFADLIFRFNGRWYIVDYKSNFLGSAYSDYNLDAMTKEMMTHHYILQYCLYTVALHRYLEHRLPGYNYDQHFGGIFYLFIRGMCPDLEAGCGIFSGRPSKSLILALAGLS